VGWQRIRDRKKVRRAELAVGAELAALWGYTADSPATAAVHTRRFTTADGRRGYLYTDGHVDWETRDLPPPDPPTVL
jgi:hypothetical protein